MVPPEPSFSAVRDKPAEGPSHGGLLSKEGQFFVCAAQKLLACLCSGGEGVENQVGLGCGAATTNRLRRRKPSAQMLEKAFEGPHEVHMLHKPRKALFGLQVVEKVPHKVCGLETTNIWFLPVSH